MHYGHIWCNAILLLVHIQIILRMVKYATCQLNLSIRHWALEKLNFKLSDSTHLRLKKMNKIDELRFHADESSTLYNEKIKLYDIWKIRQREFQFGGLVLLCNSRLHLFPSRLNSLVSKWCNRNTIRWWWPIKVNGQFVKKDLANTKKIKEGENLGLDKVLIVMQMVMEMIREMVMLWC